MKLNLRDKITSVMLLAATQVAMASPNNNVQLQAPSSGPLQACVAMFQYIVNFAGGAGCVFVVFLSLVAAICLWVAAPKAGSQAMGWAFRACVGGILVFNIALFIGYLEAPTTT